MTQPPQQRPRWRAILPYIAVGAAVVALIIGGYWVPWTGFDGYYDAKGDYQRGKTLWDWLSLLIIPFALALTAYWLNRLDRASEQKLADERRVSEQKLADERRASEQKLADERRVSEQKLAADNLREATLQTFFTRMSELLLDKGLRTSCEDAEIRHIARAYTLSTLRLLDSHRKGILLQFLYDSALIGQGPQSVAIIRMEGMDITGVDLEWSDFHGADLRGANLQGANLHGANLQGANLEWADLQWADLEWANLQGANLEWANLQDTNLEGAKLKDANLKWTNLKRANLPQAITQGINSDPEHPN